MHSLHSQSLSTLVQFELNQAKACLMTSSVSFGHQHGTVTLTSFSMTLPSASLTTRGPSFTASTTRSSARPWRPIELRSFPQFLPVAVSTVCSGRAVWSSLQHWLNYTVPSLYMWKLQPNFPHVSPGKGNRHQALPNNPGVVTASCQFLTDVASLAKAHCTSPRSPTSPLAIAYSSIAIWRRV